MILRPRPGAWALLFVLRGSIVPVMAPRLLSVALLGVLVVVAARQWPGWVPQLPLPAFALFGLAFSIFLGFRNNVCYDRWWEARSQWGRLIVETRGLARESTALLGPRPELVRRGIGFTHALCARLRKRDELAAARPWLPAEEVAAIAASPNIPDAILLLMNAELARLWREGALSDMLYRGLVARLQGLAEMQSACERILTTPLPFAYTLLLHRAAFLFCLLVPFGLVGVIGLATPIASAMLAYAFFGLDVLGDQLEDPFGEDPNDLPLNAITRMVEIELLATLGETDLPPPLEPVDYFLS
ncbi:bestrophin family protein [Roseomonas marmotae]|uniref:Bestrophin family protein n=1 Tax=Roseomonas marmotae TaxID=2768161 RepID=A0ABS3K965_9PROT|nr:bestrophin family protein [Roseomonas marmotae]MBO1074007.1 bestrophin family protein [Roseomonas marmotae]QTI78795.1 bestrophin family protein [Roseomonas marmotae]